VLLTSERSLLTLVVPARDLRSLAERHTDALRELLESAQANESLIALEILEMREHRIAKTRSKVVLGSMNDMAINVRIHLESHPESSLLDIEKNLAIMPCGPIGMDGPGEVAARLLVERYSNVG